MIEGDKYQRTCTQWYSGKEGNHKDCLSRNLLAKQWVLLTARLDPNWLQTIFPWTANNHHSTLEQSCHQTWQAHPIQWPLKNLRIFMVITRNLQLSTSIRSQFPRGLRKTHRALSRLCWKSNQMIQPRAKLSWSRVPSRRIESSARLAWKRPLQ